MYLFLLLCIHLSCPFEEEGQGVFENFKCLLPEAVITQADSGLARHERHQSECTQSLAKAYESTVVNDSLARQVNQCTKTSQVKGTEIVLH